MAAPDTSVMRPEIVAVSVWQTARLADHTIARRTIVKLFIRRLLVVLDSTC
jgi:hypothetical protein